MPPKLTKYIIDANVFMQAAREHYAFDIAQPFWDALVGFAQEGKILSIDKVYDEINKGNDELKKWANGDFRKYFIDSQTSDIVQGWADLVKWANDEKQYTQTAKDEFMEDENADAWALSYAKVNGCILVTSETTKTPDAKKRIPIPNVCGPNNIDSCDLYKMLRELGFSFKK